MIKLKVRLRRQICEEEKARFEIYSNTPEQRRLRSKYFLRRRLRPVVPEIHGPLPTLSILDPEQRDKYKCLYLRPWVSNRALANGRVVHLTDLNLVLLPTWDKETGIKHSTPYKRTRRKKKGPAIRECDAGKLDWDPRNRSYEESWRRYQRGNVVSDHAVRYIQQFMQVMLGTGKNNDVELFQQHGPTRRKDFGDAGDRLDLGEVMEFLKPQSRRELMHRFDDPDDPEDKPKTAEGHRANVTTRNIAADFTVDEHRQSLIEKALATVTTTGIDDPAANHHQALPEQAEPKKQKKDENEEEASRKKSTASVYARNYKQKYTTWLHHLKAQEKRPTEQQWAVLNAVHQRCKLEHEEEAADKINKTDADPLLLFIHGLPGSGKTQVMKWLRSYFEQVWGWQHARHFVYLAPMNTMAARLDGFTVHSWGEVRWQQEGPRGAFTMSSRKGNKQNMSSMAAKMEWARFILIDEIEATAAEDLGEIQDNTAESARDLLYKWRRGKDKTRQRPFGGLNVLMFGDLWQLPPPLKTSITTFPDRPRSETSLRARDMLDFFWAPTREWGCNGASPYIFDVNKRLDAHREDAEWFKNLIESCRQGAMHPIDYHFLHGRQTLVTGSWLASTGRPQCNSGQCQARCRLYTNKEARRDTLQPDTLPEECAMCARLRTMRHLVICQTKTKELPPRFLAARLITKYNRPRYYAAQMQAQLFAKTHNTQILWVQAEDFPVEGKQLTTLSPDELNKKRKDFLRRSDDKTGGIMGLFPLVYGLPVALTHQLDKERRMLKHTQATVTGWTLHADDLQAVRNNPTAEEIMLKHHPLKIYVTKKNSEDMKQHYNLPPNVYAVAPRGENWHLDQAKSLWLRRFGFPLRPDFAATVHAVTGDELEAAIANIGNAIETPTQEDALNAYIAISRVKHHEDLRIAQAFSWGLFRQGSIRLNEYFLEVMRAFTDGSPIGPEAKAEKFAAIREEKDPKKRTLEHQTFPCLICQVIDRNDN